MSPGRRVGAPGSVGPAATGGQRRTGAVPEVAALTAEIANRWAGTRSDVLRLAVPPRHATVEKREIDLRPRSWPLRVPGPGRSTKGDRRSCDGLGSGSPRAVVAVLPGDDGIGLLARAALRTAAAGRGALVCVPDHRDVERLDAALVAQTGPGRHVVLTADLGPAKRYAAFLAVSRGATRIVIGTRAAAFAPVVDLGLVAIWDDGDDLFVEPRAPYPHTREVLLMRARRTRLCGRAGRSCAQRGGAVPPPHRLGHGGRPADDRARSGRGQRHRRHGHDLERDPRARSAAAAAGAPCRSAPAWSTGRCWSRRRARATPPGWPATPAASRRRARCATGRCGSRPRHRPPECALVRHPCARAGPAPSAAGTACGLPCSATGARPRSWAAPSPARRCAPPSADRVLDRVTRQPAIVVATPGAEPVADGGYATVALLDTWLMLGRADLRAEEEAMRRWANAAHWSVPSPGRAGGPGRRPGRARRSRPWSAGTRPASPSG